MPSFPALFSGKVTLYPCERASVRRVGVCSFADATEQRWRECAPLMRFRLTVEAIRAGDYASLVTFFDTVKGGKDVFDLSIGGETFSNLVLDSDTLDMQETGEGWSGAIACHQKRKN